ncbi:hypothetical protein VQ056_27355 [Paenibacillus sp. JTLBN-2024]
MKRKGSIWGLVFVLLLAILSGCGGKKPAGSGSESGEPAGGDAKRTGGA